MGMSKCLYVGPYFECTQRAAKTKVSVHGCTNKECQAYPRQEGRDSSAKFCPVCGTRIGTVIVEVDYLADAYEVIGDEMHNLCYCSSNRKVLLAPNVKRKGDPRWELDDDGEVHLDLSKVKHEDEMRWLEKAFAPELKKLRAAFAKVEVKWGVHQYFM